MNIVGERLRALREGIGLSQERLVKLNGSNQSSLGRYENGISSPSFELLLWYADYFDVSMDYIFGRTDKPQGTLYDFQPKYEDNDDIKHFIEMCFDSNSPMSGKLKDTLLKMITGGDDK
jgi:transcriptional regulator with XRE-family HTH domain